MTSREKADGWAIRTLVALASCQIHGRNIETPLTIASRRDWEQLCDAAREHEVEPLLGSARVRRSLVGVSEEEVAALEQRSGELLRRNLFLTGELRRLLTLLAEAGVPALVLKGPVLAELAFGSLADRQFVDLDVLVRREQIEPTLPLLQDEGYEVTPEPMRFRDWNRQIQLYRPDKDVTVELHWGVLPAYFLPNLDMDPWWNRAGTVTTAGVEMPTLSMEDQVALACLHGAKHSWRALKWVADLGGLLVRQPNLDWDRLHRFFEALRAPRVLALGVGLAHELLGAPAPASVVGPFDSDATLRTLRDAVYRRWGLDPQSATPPLSGLSFASRLLPGIGQKTRLWWGAATSPTLVDFGETPLPAALHGAYSLVRPLRLATKLARRLAP